MAKKDDASASNTNPGTGLNPDAPVSNLASTVRDAKADEKPDPTTVAQVQEITSDQPGAGE